MINANNPAVNLATRRFLRGLIHESVGVDEQGVSILEKAIEKVKAISPSGWVFLLARALGASEDDAMEAASFSELYYAMCSFTDDVQDGDADEYMREGDQRLLVNTLAQLICVTVVRGDRLFARIGREDGLESPLSRAFLDGAVMLRGQRIELLREGWSTGAYKKVATLSGGRQLDVYFRAAALVAGTSPRHLLEMSDPLGLLIQVLHDRSSGDERLLSLPASEVAAMVSEAKEDLACAAVETPSSARAVIDVMVELACEVSES